MYYDIQTLASRLLRSGIRFHTTAAADHADQLEVVNPLTNSWAFSVAPRQEGTFILGFRRCLRISDEADPVAVVVQLISLLERNLEPDLTALPLVSYPGSKFFRDGATRRSEQWRSDGWIALEGEEDAAMWDEFSSCFHMRRSMEPGGWPAIVEPTPFVTWSVAHCMSLYEPNPVAFWEIEHRSRREFLSALGASSAQRFYALDQNHQGYRFQPEDVLRSPVDRWPVFIIPIGNYYLFCDKSYSMGLFSHPWERSICVFGKPLLDHLQESPLACVGGVLRSS